MENKKTKMPTAKKRDIRNEKRRQINKAFKTRVKTAVRQLEESIQEQQTEVLPQKLNAVYSLMDKAAKRGLYKRAKADRLKSRLSQRAAAATR